VGKFDDFVWVVFLAVFSGGIGGIVTILKGIKEEFKQTNTEIRQLNAHVVQLFAVTQSHEKEIARIEVRVEKIEEKI
jgi:septal ring factor EnvC (AmiA/AmiB activator)